MGFPDGSVVKNLPVSAGDKGLIPVWGRSPGKRNGNPFQYSCLRNPMDREPGRLQSMELSTKESDILRKKHKLESRLPGEISITSDMQMTPPLWQKVKRN